MNRGALLWLLIFAISALAFFLIAAVVAFKGISDLLDLLHHDVDNMQS